MVNRMCEQAQVDLLIKGQIKCLPFVSGMKKEAHSDFRTRLLQKLELQTNCTLEDLCNEWEHILSLRKDANAIGEVPSAVQVVQRNSRKKKPRPKSSQAKNLANLQLQRDVSSATRRLT